jgi:hypothetical protein
LWVQRKPATSCINSPTVIASDIGVQVEPDAFDAVSIGAIGRQEVQDDAASEAFDDSTRVAALVDTVVIQDDVDALGRAMLSDEMLKQLARSWLFLRAPGT